MLYFKVTPTKIICKEQNCICRNSPKRTFDPFQVKNEMRTTKFLAHVALLINGLVRMKLDVSASASMWPWLTDRSECLEVERRSELTPKETESGSCRVNVPVYLAEPEESTLHQLQLRPEGLMGRATRQGSRVRRPLSARANWSLRPGLTLQALCGETHPHAWSCSERSLPSKCPRSRRSLLCSWSRDQSDFHSNSQPPSTFIADSTTYGDSWAGQRRRKEEKRAEGVDHSRHFNPADQHSHFQWWVRSQKVYKWGQNYTC